MANLQHTRFTLPEQATPVQDPKVCAKEATVLQILEIVFLSLTNIFRPLISPIPNTTQKKEKGEDIACFYTKNKQSPAQKKANPPTPFPLAKTPPGQTCLFPTLPTLF